MQQYLWLIFALLSAAAASLVGIFGKVGLKDLDANTATAIRAVIMAVFLFAVVAIQGKLGEIPAIISNKRGITFICLSGIAGATSWLFYFLALKFGKVSQVAPVDKLSVVISIILAVLFLGEKLNVMNGLGTVLITAGVIMVALA